MKIYSYLALFVIHVAICLDKPPTEDVFVLEKGKNTDNSLQFTIPENKEFYVQISGNKTTGYLWYLDVISLDMTFVQPLNIDDHDLSLDYFMDDNPRGYAGVGGRYYFHFKSLKPGKVKVSFYLKRPWEYDSIQTESVEINIIAVRDEL